MNVGLQIRISGAPQDQMIAQHVLNTPTTGWTRIRIDAEAPETGELWILCYPYGVTSGTIYIDNFWFNSSDLIPAL